MIRELCEVESAAVAAFMLNLCERDRHLRFCRPMIDSAIRDYVAAIDWENAAVLGAFDDSAQLIGLLELCDAGTGAELAVVVAVDHREHGVAHALMLRGLRKAKAMGTPAGRREHEQPLRPPLVEQALPRGGPSGSAEAAPD